MYSGNTTPVLPNIYQYPVINVEGEASTVQRSFTETFEHTKSRPHGLVMV